MPHIAVIGNNGGLSSEHLADCVARATGKRLLVDMENIWLNLDQGKVWHEGMDLTRLDAVIIKRVGPSYSPHLLDRLEILRILENSGVRIFSRPLSILRVLDRLSCTVTLRMAGIPMPPTTITENTEQAVNIIEAYGEAVLKPLYSSKARGMWVLQYGRDTYITVEDFKRNNPILYIQKKMNLQGMDLGVVFLGGEYLTTYARCSDGTSWNTAVESGGRYAACDPSPETIEIAGKAQALFDLDFTIVDVVETPDGPLVFEVSAFGGFKGMKTARNMDGAACYVEYVMKRLAS
jgi:ribosomal protein S6--L-glutamate ligase